MNTDQAITITDPMVISSEPAPRDPLQPGARVGAFRILSKLARGGFGDVWRAENIATGGVVAFKVLHAELVANPATVARFEREAEAMTLLRHPNVIELYAAGKLADGRPYFVMEYLSGVDLERYIQRRGALTAEETLSILEPLADALHAVHGRGIVHRDLKALNVFIAGEGDDRRVVLLDFGIAKLLEGGGPALTAAKCTVGSPVCMAPEQIRGERVAPRTDVYALGSLVFQMLTGELPFPGAGTQALRMHLSERRPRPSERAPISSAFDDVVVRAMAKDSSRRFATAPELAAAFREALVHSRSATGPAVSADAAAVGLYLDVRADGDALDDPDEDLLDDLDAIAAIAGDQLEQQGWTMALEQGDCALYVRTVEGDADDARRSALADARELLAALADRSQSDPRVRITAQLHLDSCEVSRGMAVGGALFEFSNWVVTMPVEGVVCTDAAISGLDVPARQVSRAPLAYRIEDA